MKYILSLSSLLRPILLLLALASASAASIAQEKTNDASMRYILEAEQKAEQLVEEMERADPNGFQSPKTPLTSILGLRGAVQESNFARAAEFLDTRFLPEDVAEYEPEALIKALSYVWSQQNIVDLGTLSDEPAGHLDDGLPSYRDQIGSVTISTGEVPIYIQRVPDGKGGKVWKLSNATVARIPEMWDELGYSPIAITLSKILPDFKFMGMDNWQLIATLAFLVIAWPLAALISATLMRIALLIPNRFPLGIQRFFRVSARFFLFIMIARLLMNQLGLSLTARVYLESSGVDYVAYTALLLGLLSLGRDYQIRRMEHAGNAQYAALLKPLTIIVKVLVITILALIWADQAGYNMSTIIAGLGVGSLAVALAAQKTLENVIGAITLYTARPVNPGDLCRFGTVTGTVEEIGLRSTLIRTLNRTMLVVPNSVFSAVEIENFSSRDRIRYFRNVELQMATADQLRLIMVELRQLFYSHPMVLQETVSVRFERIEQATAVLRLDAGVPTINYQEFLAVAEDLNLHIVELVHGAGAIFSGPGQVLQLREFKQASDEEMTKISAMLQDWREQDKLPFPDHSAAEKEAFKASLDYPPQGSPG
ncbi:MAG: MscS family membrane protein [Halieaceae bacterium]|jgi:MscS family membrane protein